MKSPTRLSALLLLLISPFLSAEAPYTVSASKGGRVDITSPPFDTTKKTVSITATPSAGHSFSHWTGTYRETHWSGTFTSRINPLLIEDRHATVHAVFKKNEPQKMALGQNLVAATYYSTAWPFTDSMMLAGPWVNATSKRKKRPPLNAQGYPLSVPYDDGVNDSAIVRCLLPNQVKGGYHLSFEGKGIISINGSGVTKPVRLQGKGGVTEADVGMNGNGRFGKRPSLRIHLSDKNDPIRNIRLYYPGCKGMVADHPFHPQYLGKTENFAVVRFMDWGQTNSSSVKKWKDRTPMGFYSQAHPATRGVALEHQIELLRRTSKDGWFCVPHLADDDYVTQMATLIRDSLSSQHKIYIEYSNETWNASGNFQQTHFTRDLGSKLDLSKNAWKAGNLYHCKRSAEIWKIFHDTFSKSRYGVRTKMLVFVMAAQASNNKVAEFRLKALSDPKINPAGIAPHILAIAPYFGHGIKPSYLKEHGYPTVDELVTTMSIDQIKAARNKVKEHKALADKHGLRLTCYEAGQHWLAARKADRDAKLVNTIMEANRDPRMGDRYTEYLSMLNEEGVDLCVNFLDIQAPTRNGSWGALEHQDQSIDEAPKAKAIHKWLSPHHQK